MALLLSGSAIAVSLLLIEILAPTIFIFLFAAVVLSSWYGGAGPGLLSTLVGMIGALGVIVPSSSSQLAGDPHQLSRLGLFVLVSVLISGLSESRATRQQRDVARDLLDRLQRLTTALSGSQAEWEVIASIVEKGMLAIGAPSIVLMAMNDEKDALETIHARGWPGDPKQLAPVPLTTDSLSTAAFRSGRPEFVRNTREYFRRYPHLERLRSSIGAGACVSVPLMSREGPLGVLAIVFAKPRRFSQEDLGFLETVGHLAGQALERARWNEKIRLDAERHGEVLERAPAGIALTVGGGRILEANPHLGRLIGLSAGSLAGSRLTSLAHPDDRVELERALAEGTRERPLELRLLHENGTSVWASVSVAMAGRGAGVDSAVVVVEDLTSRRFEEMRQRTLAEAGRLLSGSLDVEETLRAIAFLLSEELADFSAVDLVTSGGSRRLRVAHLNPKLLAFRGRLEALPPGPSLWDVEGVMRRGEALLIREVDEEGSADIPSDPAARQLLQEMGVRSLIVVPMMIRGKALGAISLFSTQPSRRDSEREMEVAQEIARRAAVTLDNARLFGKLRAADAAKGRFLAILSHEIRTPLNAVLGYAELLANEVSGPMTAGQQKSVERIRASGRLLVELIDEVLTFSRLESGQEQLRIASVDLTQLCKEAGAVVEPIAAKKGIALSICAEQESLTVSTDAGKFRQIVINLMSNAVKFTEVGLVKASLERRIGDVVLHIVDTGPGIHSADQERVFDAFARAELSTQGAKGGSGLGLAVSRRLARLLGGDIELESELGRGSRFSVRIPVPLHAVPESTLPDSN